MTGDTGLRDNEMSGAWGGGRGECRRFALAQEFTADLPGFIGLPRMLFRKNPRPSDKSRRIHGELNDVKTITHRHQYRIGESTMPLLFDMPLAELESYQGTNPKPDDFDAYWDAALAEMEALDPQVELIPADFQSAIADCFHLWFTGVGGARIYAKLMRPKRGDRTAPSRAHVPRLLRRCRRLVGQAGLCGRGLHRGRAGLPRPGRTLGRCGRRQGLDAARPHRARAGRTRPKSCSSARSSWTRPSWPRSSWRCPMWTTTASARPAAARAAA